MKAEPNTYDILHKSDGWHWVCSLCEEHNATDGPFPTQQSCREHLYEKLEKAGWKYE